MKESKEINEGDESKSKVEVSQTTDTLSKEEILSIQHDMRNALANMELALYHLKDEVSGKESTQHLIKIIERNCLKIKNITDLRLK